MASKTNKINTLVNQYLIIYNSVQFFGWLYILYVTVDTYLTNLDSRVALWKNVELPLKIFQTAALLEIVHSLLGLVKSSWLTTTMQVYSRVLLVWPILNYVPASQSSVGLLLLLICWCVTEIIRYSFYGSNLLGYAPYLIQWCRYNFFIVLYPIGVFGELLCCYAALPFHKRTAMFSYHMPNQYNFVFDFYYLLVFTMIGYIPGLPQLYMYMIHQRKKFYIKYKVQ